MQFRILAEDVVQGGKMEEKAFLRRILRSASMPVALVRMLVNGQELTSGMNLDWKFYGQTVR